MAKQIRCDFHCGYDFTIRTWQPVKGGRFVGDITVYRDGVQVMPTIQDMDNCWDTEELAYGALRQVAWKKIDELVRRAQDLGMPV